MFESTGPRLLCIIPGNQSAQSKFLGVIKEAMKRKITCDLLCYNDKSWDYVNQHLDGESTQYHRKRVPAVLQWLLERSNSSRLSVRAALWCAALATRSFQGYAGAIASGDTTPIESVVGRRVPLLVFQATVDYFNSERAIQIQKWGKSRKDMTFLEKFLFLTDRIVGNRLLPRVGGQVAKFGAGTVVIDAIFGPWPVAAIRGMGTSRYFCIAGEAYADINRALGLPAKKLVVTGLLEFDRLMEIAALNHDDKFLELLQTIGANKDEPIISFFSSPQRVLDEKFRFYVDEFKMILDAINHWLPDYQIIFAHHPKFADAEEGYQYVEQALSNIRNLTIVRQNGDPDFNAKLVTMSEIVISPGTLGMSGAALRKPVLSYSFKSEHWGEINRTLQLSVHVTNQEELDCALQSFREQGAFEGLADRQELASVRYFNATGTAASDALDLLLAPAD
jgi:hypothetical protein